MDERSAARYTCKTLSDAWNRKDMRSNFRTSAASLLDWLLNYAPNPFEALFDLVEQFLTSVDSDEPIKLFLEHFDAWLTLHAESQSPEQSAATNLNTSENQVRAFKIFGRYRPNMLALLSLCQIPLKNVAKFSDAAYSIFSHLLSARRHDEALTVFQECPSDLRAVISERHMTHMALYLICIGNQKDAHSLFEKCTHEQRRPVLNFLDSLLGFSDREFDREVCCCPNIKCVIGKPELEEFIEKVLNDLSLSIKACPSLLMRSKIKLFRFLTQKAISSNKPQMDVPSFCEIVLELGEHDSSFQEHVTRVLKSLGQSELAHYFSRNFSRDNDGPSSKRPRVSTGHGQRPPPPPPPPVLAQIDRKSSKSKSNRKLHSLPLDDGKVVFVNTLDAFRSVIDKLVSSSLVAFRLFWRRQMPAFLDKSKRQIALSMLAVAIPNNVFLLDLTRLPQLLGKEGGFLFWIRDVLESDKVTRLVFRPNEDLRTLQRELSPTSSVQQFTMSSLRDLAVFVDPKRRRRSTLSSLSRRWLGEGLPTIYRFTNWLRRPLSREQMRHAALECYVMLEIYSKMSTYCSMNQVDFASLRRLTLKAVDDDDLGHETDEDGESSSSDSENNCDLFPPNCRLPGNGSISPIGMSLFHHQTSDFSEDNSRSSHRSRISNESPAVETKFTVTVSMPPPLLTSGSSPYPIIAPCFSDNLPPPLLGPSPTSNYGDHFGGFIPDSEPISMMTYANTEMMMPPNPYANEFDEVPLTKSISNNVAVAVRSSRDVYFLIGDEFAEVALELVRIGFPTQLCSRSECSSAGGVVACSLAKGLVRRVFAGRPGIAEEISRKFGPTSGLEFPFEGVELREKSFEETGRAVSQLLLRQLQIAPKVVEAQFSRTRKYPAPHEDPLVIFHPRAYFPRNLREILRPRIYICPVPTGENISDDQLAIMAGLGEPNTNRVLLTDGTVGPRLQARYGASLRILIIPKMYTSMSEQEKLASCIIEQLRVVVRTGSSKRPSSSVATISIPSNSSSTMETASVKRPSSAASTSSASTSGLASHKSPLAKYSLLCCIDNMLSNSLVEYLEAVGFCCSRLVANNLPFKQAFETSKAGKKLLLASASYAHGESSQDFICVDGVGSVLTTLFSVADKLSCSDLLDSRLISFKKPPGRAPHRLALYGNLHRNFFEFLTQFSSLLNVMFIDSSKVTFEKLLEIVAKENRILITDAKHCTALAAKSQISYILLAPDSIVEEAKFIFRHLNVDPSIFVPDELREPLKQLKFITHSAEALTVGWYLQLAGCKSVRTDRTSMAFTDVCNLAKRENSFVLARNSETNRLYLQGNNQHVVSPDMVIFLPPSCPLVDSLKLTFEKVTAFLKSAPTECPDKN